MRREFEKASCTGYEPCAWAQRGGGECRRLTIYMANPKKTPKASQPKILPVGSLPGVVLFCVFFLHFEFLGSGKQGFRKGMIRYIQIAACFFLVQHALQGILRDSVALALYLSLKPDALRP